MSKPFWPPQLAAFVLLGATLLSSAAPVAARGRSHAWLHVSPSTVKIGKTATLTGGGLGPRDFYTLLFALPGLPKPKAARFLGLVRTNRSGRLRMSIRLPLITHCGKATVYALGPKLNVEASGKLTLSGCTISGSVKPPPPPPSPKKPKH